MAWMTGMLLLVGSADGCLLLLHLEPSAMAPAGSTLPNAKLNFALRAMQMLHIGSSHVRLAMLPAADVLPRKGPAVKVVALADNGAVVHIPMNRSGNTGGSCHAHVYWQHTHGTVHPCHM